MDVLNQLQVENALLVSSVNSLLVRRPINLLLSKSRSSTFAF